MFVVACTSPPSFERPLQPELVVWASVGLRQCEGCVKLPCLEARADWDEERATSAGKAQLLMPSGWERADFSTRQGSIPWTYNPRRCGNMCLPLSHHFDLDLQHLTTNLCGR
eukprot:s1578_g8.t1